MQYFSITMDLLNSENLKVALAQLMQSVQGFQF